MQTSIVKWGNGQGIRIPKGLMQELGIDLNEKLSITVQDGRLIIEKEFRHLTLEERAAAYGGKLGPYKEFDWGKAEGREEW